jgi:hypothetical protein
MPISLKCACGRALRAKDELAGRKVRCPQCSAVLNVPQAARKQPAREEILDAELLEPPVRAAAPPVARASDSYAAETGAGDEPRPVRRPKPPTFRPRKPRRQPKVAFERGWFGSTNSGVVGGILMMVIAVVWFVLGLMAGWLFYYPPVLLVIGLIAMIKGLMSER